MAAVSVSPLPPHNLSSMSDRSRSRGPLSNNTNAVNSPYRSVVAAAAASKQKRSHGSIQREEAYGQPPPAKRQMLETQQPLKTPPRQQTTQSSAEGRVFTRRSNNSQQSSFERKLISVRDRPQQTVTRAEKSQENHVERLRWQAHHRKLFPTFVFYFESIPEDVRIKYAKKVKALGAREEKFFDKAVTHVVTTRDVPADIQPTSTDATVASSTTNESQESQPKTINPSLLDRSSESASVHSDVAGKGKFTFEASMGKRAAANASHDAVVAKTQGRNSDVLLRARDMGMKIWALEKLQRMMDAMFDTNGLPHGHNTRSNSVQGSTSNSRAREADLSQLLRNERINGPSDRDPTVATKEFNLFKGPFIYVHDIDEKQKPIMVREYPKVNHKSEGDWPQFRSVANGKCPFVEDPEALRREEEKARELLRLQRQQEREKSMLSRSRTTSAEPNRMQPPKPVLGKRVLSELEDGSNRNGGASQRQSSMTAQSKPFLPRIEREASSQRSQQNAFVSKNKVGAGRLLAGEPVASGVQPSNTTSAICSNITSSTAPQPGIKAGTSKEVHGLQRKVLEKNSGGPASYGGLTSSHRIPDIRSAAREELRSARGRGPEKLTLIEEDLHHDEVEEHARYMVPSRRPKEAQKKVRRDSKPGYCENCQDKFEDFDEHTQTRKHRRFAEKLENWKDLDALLKQLQRPLREAEEDDF